MNKRLYKTLCKIENAIAGIMIFVGIFLTTGYCEDFKKQLIVNGIGLVMFALGVFDLYEKE